MGTNSMAAAVGMVIGPVLGGALVNLSWHWVFWFNVPLSLVGSAWAYRVLRETGGREEDTTFDAIGTGTFLVGLTGLVLGISKGGVEGWHGPIVFGGLAAAAILLPLFVLIERNHRAPMLDLRVFSNRMFSTAAAAAFLNGLARFALMFIFVFYFQGVQGDTPLAAGLKLAPLAVGMLVASPLAGAYADRNGSKALASVGMIVTAVGIGLMTTLQQNTSYWWPALFQLIAGIGSGMFNSPNTAAMMSVVSPHRRGIAAGTRVLVQNTGCVLSIAFVMAIVTTGISPTVLFSIFSGLGTRISATHMGSFMSNLHVALWCMAGLSILGAIVSFARPKHVGQVEGAATDRELGRTSPQVVAAG
jgi:MFS family permease